MEIGNWVLVLGTAGLGVRYSFLKKKEIEMMKIDGFEKLDARWDAEAAEMKALKHAHRDRDNLEYVSSVFNEIQNAILNRMLILALIAISLIGLLVWKFLEEGPEDYAQPILFMFGVVSQLIAGLSVIKGYNCYDPRTLFLSR